MAYDSIWKNIYDYLEKQEVKVFAPAQHVGICKEEYVVVKDGGLNRVGDFSSQLYVFNVLCYVPKDKFSSLDLYVSEIKGHMKGLSSFLKIKPTYSETPSFFDEEIQAHMKSVQYEVAVKIA